MAIDNLARLASAACVAPELVLPQCLATSSNTGRCIPSKVKDARDTEGQDQSLLWTFGITCNAEELPQWFCLLDRGVHLCPPSFSFSWSAAVLQRRDPETHDGDPFIHFLGSGPQIPIHPQISS